MALAMGAAPRAGASGQVVLNHLYVYLDSASYHGLAGSGFVRDSFASVRHATISDTRASWSGLYLFGRTTYLEIFQAGPTTPPPGTVALAFGVDRAGDLEAVAARLTRAGRPGLVQIRRRAVGTDTIPWFRQLSSGAGDSAMVGPWVTWWVMEYDPTYLARRPGGEMTLGSGVDRARYNRPLFRSDLLMRDVDRVVLRLPESVRVALAAQLGALGLAANRAGDTVRFRADSVLVDLLPAGGRSTGLTEIQFAIRPDQRHSRRRLGGATLAVGGARARLALDPRDQPGGENGCSFLQRTVMVAGRAVAVCKGGNGGPLVVFESGLGEGIGAWSKVLGRVSESARVLSYDRAGIGGSTAVPGERSGPVVAAELAALLDQLGERAPVILVGHSLGGLFVRAFHDAFPERLRGMVLVDPTPEGFARRQREVLGPERYAAYRARVASRLTGAASREWDAIPLSEAAVRSSGRLARGTLLSAGKVENPDPNIGPRMKATWLELHRSIAQRLGLEHQVILEGGHYLQDDAPERILAAIRRLTTDDSP